MKIFDFPVPKLKTMRILMVFLLISLHSQLFSQSNQIGDLTPHALTVPSPDAFSLGKYGFGKIGQYNGTTGISIPIHEMKFEELSIPIVLSYNMNGLRPAEEASWVGLGWDLMATAVITRKINGGDDFNSTYGLNGQLGWIYQPSLNISPGITPNVPLAVQDSYAYQSGPCGTPDTQPDLFTVNLLGKTIRFILINKAANQGVVGVKVLTDLTTKVEYEGAAGAGNFLITDDHGYKYLFNVKEKSNNIMQYCPTMTTAWYLSSITSMTGNAVTFGYRSNQELTMSQSHVVEQTWGVVGTGGFGTTPSPSVVGSQPNQSVSSLTYLETISYEGEVIQFNTSTRSDLLKSTVDIIGGINLNNLARRLTTIQIKFDNSVKKTINLYQSYFNGSQATDLENYLRLKLDSVDVVGQKYKFQYLNQDMLPSKTTKSVDYFGYSNGKINSKRYPTFYYLSEPISIPNSWMVLPGGDLSADGNFSKYGMLWKIDYPTGGSTSYEYEGNRAMVGVDDFDEVDVARLENKTINTYNGTSGQTVEYDFSIGQSMTFYGNSDPISRWVVLDLAITTGNRYPVPPITGSHPNINSVAAELINLGTNTVIFSTIYRDYTDFCSTQSPYCFGSHKYFSGALPVGNYRVRLYGTITSLDTELTIRIPVENLSPAPTLVEKEVGGLRVKRVTDYTWGNQLQSSRSYSYTDANGNSSGALMNVPIFNQRRRKWEGPATAGTVIPYLDYVVVTSAAMNSISQSAMGSGIGYSIVTESFESQVNASKNYSIRTSFTNLPASTTPWSVQTLQPGPYSAAIYQFGGQQYGESAGATKGIYDNGYSVLNGLILKEEYFSNSASLQRKVENTYTISSYPGFGGFAALTGLWCNGTCPAPSTPIVALKTQYFSVEKFLLTQTKTIDYAGSDGKEFQSDVTYDNKWLESTIATIDSKGNSNVSKKYYVHQYTDGANYALSLFNMLAKPVKSEVSVNGNLIFGQVLTYGSGGLPTNLYSYESAAQAAPPTHDPSIVVPNGYIEKMSYNYAGSKLRQVNNVAGIPKSYCWGYNAHFIIAETEGAQQNEVFHTSFENEEGGTVSADAKTGSNTKTGGYLRSIGGLTIGKDYVLTYWQKSGSGWSPQTTVILALSNSTYSIDIDGEIDEVRFYPKGSKMTTYTYNPLIGVGTKTDANNLVTKFEYDGFGRLVRIKDFDGNILKQHTYHFRTP